jgi:hypothetical protein
VEFQILDINGNPPPPQMLGWKDTVQVPPGSRSTRIMFRNEGFTGTYVFHCHKLEHEDHRMMAQESVTSNTCTPETNTAFCARLGRNCGSVTANDNCGTSRTVGSCGTCTAPQTCGGGGTANVCGGGGTGGNCAPPYAQANCLSYVGGQTVVSSGGHNYFCANANCRNCATFASCAPGATGCPWGAVWTDRGVCQ